MRGWEPSRPSSPTARPRRRSSCSLAAIKNTTDPTALRGLAAVWSPPGQAQRQPEPRRRLEPFLAAIKGTTDPYALWTLGAGLGALPAKLSDSQAKEVVEPFLAAIKSHHSTAQLPSRCPGCGAGSPPGQAQRQPGQGGGEPFLAAIEGNRTTAPPSSGRASSARSRRRQARRQPGQGGGRAVSRRHKAATASCRRSPGRGLGALPAKLSDSQAKQAVEPFLAATQRTTDTADLQAVDGAWEPSRPTQRQPGQGGSSAPRRHDTHHVPHAVGAPGRGRGAARPTHRQSAKAANVAPSKVLERLRLGNFSYLSHLSMKLTRDEPADVQVRNIFRLLRHPRRRENPRASSSH